MAAADEGSGGSDRPPHPAARTKPEPDAEKATRAAASASGGEPSGGPATDRGVHRDGVAPDGPSVQLVVEWEGDRRYRGGRPGRPTVLLDGARTAGPGAVDTVVLALATCSAIDVVEILKKRRTPVRSLRITADYTRADGETPRRLTGVRLTFHIATDSTVDHVRRAVALTLEKYCSVAGSLAPEVVITTDVEMVSG